MYEKYVKKCIALAVILLFIGLAFAPSINANIQSDFVEKSSTSSFHGSILYVGGSGPGNYSKIQDAIDDASDGDTVYVYNGTYYEYVNIKKRIDLIGENRDTTIIDGSNGWSATVEVFSPSFVKITGFTIKVSNNSLGGIALVSGGEMMPADSNNNTIYRNIIINGRYGIALHYSSGNNISGNNITNHKEYGILVYGESEHNTIYQNNIMKNRGYGLYLMRGLDGSPNYNTIYHNNFFSNYQNGRDGGPDNHWDNGIEGNYWHNYKGEDLNDDGIGDKPYRIGPFWSSVKDYYPLMKPFNNITSFTKYNNNFNHRFIIRWIDCLLDRFPIFEWLLGFIWHPAKEPHLIGV